MAWAVNRAGQEIRWNHLIGDGIVVNYAQSTSWEYNAYVFAAISADHGEQSDGVPGQLLLDGIEYDNAFDRVQFDFYASGSDVFSSPPAMRSRPMPAATGGGGARGNSARGWPKLRRRWRRLARR